MQISDAPGPPPAAKEEVRPVGDDRGGKADGQSGDRFRDTLRRKKRGAVEGEGRDAATAAAMTGWFRHEATPPAPAAPAARATGPAVAAAARTVDRILIGSGPEGAQARIRIGAGTLAGTEIQLATGAGGNTVEARLLTHAASSRQTLAVALDEIRSRLRAKGIVLSARAPADAGRARAVDAEADAVGASPRAVDAPGARR